MNGEISIEKLHFSYEDGPRAKTIFDGLTAKITRGVTAVIGRSGRGKSTLLKLISGELPIRKSTGVVTFGGEPINAARRIGKIAMLPQVFQPAPWLRADENVALLLRRARGAPKKIVIARDRLSRLALDEQGAFRPRQLSGGMQRRVALAMLLATDAPYLLLDEPFASLDWATREECYEYFLRVAAGQERTREGPEQSPALTTVVVTHDLEEAALLADKVWVLPSPPICEVEVIDNPCIQHRHLGIESMRLHKDVVEFVSQLRTKTR